MKAQASQSVLKVLPSFADFAFLMPVVFLFGRMAGLKTLFGDCDTGWHIRTGEWIVANHGIPARDIFSFSKPGDPWFAWEWLSDVVFAWINGHGGLRAVALFTILLLGTIFTLVYHLVRRKSNVIVAVSITMLTAVCSSIHWLARPHLFTLLFLVLFYGALERVSEGRTHLAGVPYLVMFPPAIVLWTNLHGGFIVGILMICAYGGGEFLQFILNPEAIRRHEAFVRSRNYFRSAVACMAASLINPYTYHLHVHMAQYLRDPWNAQHIAEFLSPSFHHPMALFFEAMLTMAVAAAYWTISKGRYTEAILMVLWAHAALLAARNIPIFGIAAAPVVAAMLQSGLDRAADWNVAGWVRRSAAKFNLAAQGAGEKELVGRWHLVSVLGVALVAAVIWAPNPPKKFRAEFDPNAYPAAALASLGHSPDARIFTNDEWGDYLIWSRQRVFVDGRSDFYGDDFENKYVDVLNVKYGWEQTLQHFGVNTILMPPDAPLTGALKESSHWEVVYDDGISVVFRPRQAAGVTTLSAMAQEGGGSRDREITKTNGNRSIDHNGINNNRRRQ
jgi:hypothetical protein